MIAQKDILNKCRTLPALQPLWSLLSSRDFTQEELEAIDYTIELFITMQQTISHLQDILVIKLQIWLSSIKNTG